MQEEGQRKGFMGGIARALNYTGSFIVSAYDVSADFTIAVYNQLKKTPELLKMTPELMKKTMELASKTNDLVAGGISKIKFKQDESGELENKIAVYEEKIKDLFYEIGQEGATAEKLESEKAKKLISDVKEYEKEIQRLKGRITELDEIKKIEQLKKKEKKDEEKKSSESKLTKKKLKHVDTHVVNTNIKSKTDKAIKHGEFDTDSDRAIFSKIAADLLDSDMEIKILAAAELGKMSNKAAVPILLEVVNYNNPFLTTEVVNSLTNIGDTQATELFVDLLTDPAYRVRLSSLRGLYKLGEGQQINQILTDSLKDEHPEIRRMAATYIGWKDITDAVPSLVQSLNDKDPKVRKAAVITLSSLKNKTAVLPMMRLLGDDSVEIREKTLESLNILTGESITFDTQLSGKDLAKAIEDLKDWWQKEKLGKIESLDLPVEDVLEVQEYVEDSPQTQAQVQEPAEASATTETHESITEAVLEAIADTEETAATETKDDSTLSVLQLSNLTKSEIIAMCNQRGIECDDTFTKTELIELYLK
ncbi:MAG: HEAT repeat domain-containing protein [Nitrospirae bacterium]|uniref:Magnetosome protein Mad23 n=1 Tax=uncultured Nitrospirota bacterium TaxID=170969 RepID=A0A142BTY1_9BACT|nr:magnetosome protein Mad23 [uncultured Nitrospirota bacterium]MBF0343176.1 HEAT repeat domain-containing protein [Nitrospirota bacterium]